ncbi:hypothetical protein OSTOST_25491, partial [Ostertagia ostertagi]
GDWFVYPRLLELLRFNIQSTGQKSETHQRKHQPATDETAQASVNRPTDPVTGANPFPEVTDLICRLPLPTLFYRLEAVHLGDLMRISGRPENTRHHRNRDALRKQRPYLRLSRFSLPL